MERNCAPGTQGTLVYVSFVKEQIGSNNMPITYYSNEHMLPDFFTKTLQRYLFVNFHNAVMWWKHMDKYHMGPSSTKELAGNVDEAKFSIKEVNYRIKEERKDMGEKKLYADIVICDKTQGLFMLEMRR